MEVFRLHFSSDIRYLDRIHDITSKILEDLPINLKRKKEVLTAVSEAVTNGLVHGNKNNPAKTIKLTFCQDDGYLAIDIDDEGRGFKPQAIDLEESAKELVEDGRGIPIMMAYMDEVKFERLKGKGMRVALRKNLA